MTDGIDTAFDAIGRGFATLRANWQLVPVTWLQQVLVTALLVLGLAVPVAAIGGEVGLREGWEAVAAWQPASGAEAAEDLALAVEPIALPLVVALLGTAVVWGLAVIAFCWFQGGFFGILLAAERQALPGPPRDWRLFRTWDRALFFGWARRLVWRYFGFWNLWGLVFLAWLAAALVVFLAARAAAARWAEAGFAAVGCGGALALLASLVVLVAWGIVAPPDLARDEVPVSRSSRRALAFLARRPLPLGLVVGVFLALSMVVAMATSTVGTPLALVGVQAGFGWLLAAQGTVVLLQLAAGAAVTTAMNGALAALLVADGRGAVEAATMPPPAAAPPAVRLGEVRP
ncbi:MAG TPA: hypothetical protein VF100_04480 [Thermoanaerobaculia bacterium]